MNLYTSDSVLTGIDINYWAPYPLHSFPLDTCIYMSDWLGTSRVRSL